MRVWSIIIIAALLAGCFEENPRLPQLYVEQDINVPEDSILCVSGFEEFTHFNLRCTQSYDSVHWYRESGNSSSYLGNGNPQQLSTTALNFGGIKCLGFSNSDTTYHLLEVNNCGRFIYIPRAFNWWSGWQPGWAPLVITNNTSFSLHWEIRTLDGIKIFETSDPSERWYGGYNNSVVPRGAYFYRIELTIEGEEPVLYTGWLEMLG